MELIGMCIKKLQWLHFTNGSLVYSSTNDLEQGQWKQKSAIFESNAYLVPVNSFMLQVQINLPPIQTFLRKQNFPRLSIPKQIHLWLWFNRRHLQCTVLRLLLLQCSPIRSCRLTPMHPPIHISCFCNVFWEIEKFSIPPATRWIPNWIVCAASMVAFIPEAQTL